jgi:hypothetical protein
MSFDREFESRRAWARLAGLMYLLVLVVDLTGMQIPRPLLGKSLMLTGSLLTVPLALGLYFTLKVFQPITSGIALACRLMEALVGTIATLASFESVRTAFGGTHSGRAALELIEWNKGTSFGAFVFAIGSTLFFIVFLRSASIPRTLSWLGLVASLVALAACTTHLVWPSFPAMNAPAWIPMLVAEISTGCWLLFRPIRDVPSYAKTR